jgi:hypothetical protein
LSHVRALTLCCRCAQGALLFFVALSLWLLRRRAGAACASAWAPLKRVLQASGPSGAKAARAVDAAAASAARAFRRAPSARDGDGDGSHAPSGAAAKRRTSDDPMSSAAMNAAASAGGLTGVIVRSMSGRDLLNEAAALFGKATGLGGDGGAGLTHHHARTTLGVSSPSAGPDAAAAAAARRSLDEAEEAAEAAAAAAATPRGHHGHGGGFGSFSAVALGSPNGFSRRAAAELPAPPWERAAPPRRTSQATGWQGPDAAGDSSGGGPLSPGSYADCPTPRSPPAMPSSALLFPGETGPRVGPVLRDPADVAFAVQALPPRYAALTWRLVYATARDGTSLATLLRASAPLRGACLLLIRDAGGAAFGAFTPAPWHPHAPRASFGTGEARVLTLRPQRCVYPWARTNSVFQTATAASISLGGGSHFAVYLDADLERGSSGACDTFDSPCLASEPEFKIAALELWAFEEAAAPIADARNAAVAAAAARRRAEPSEL